MESGIYRDSAGKLDRLSPSASSSNSVFNVNGNNNAGRLDNNNANNSNGVSPTLYKLWFMN